MAGLNLSGERTVLCNICKKSLGLKKSLSLGSYSKKNKNLPPRECSITPLKVGDCLEFLILLRNIKLRDC